ncbi:hypothetical protein KY334_07480 [Candidatus Woesearchaeota archaeon]|nr:hypothetical protein [Candidatus Woesearchaeota archaeon]
MKLILFFILFLLSFSLVNANGIGASPSIIKLNETDYFYIINSELKEVNVLINSDILEFETNELLLKQNSTSKLKFNVKNNKNGFVKIQTGKGMLYEITIPVVSNEFLKESIVEKNIFGRIYLIVLFNLMVIIIGLIIWKKKSY